MISLAMPSFNDQSCRDLNLRPEIYDLCIFNNLNKLTFATIVQVCFLINLCVLLQWKFTKSFLPGQPTNILSNHCKSIHLHGPLIRWTPRESFFPSTSTQSFMKAHTINQVSSTGELLYNDIGAHTNHFNLSTSFIHIFSINENKKKASPYIK